MSRQAFTKCAAVLISLLVDAGGQPLTGPWERMELLYRERAPDIIQFVDGQIGWMCAFFPGLVKTTDGGRTWVRLESSLSTVRISSLWFLSERSAIGVGTKYEGKTTRDVIISSSDGGHRWRILRKMESGGTGFSMLWFANNRKGWLAGGGKRTGEALILATTDGGRTWALQYQTPPGVHAPGILQSVRFVNNRSGWAVGPSTILHTEDGGRTWVSQYSGKDEPLLHGLAVVSEDETWVIGGPQYVLRTKDRGKSWNKVYLPGSANDFFWNVAFDGKQGWICGAKGALFSTTDGGDTWRREPPFTQEMLVSIAITPTRIFITSDHLFAAERLR